MPGPTNAMPGLTVPEDVLVTFRLVPVIVPVNTAVFTAVILVILPKPVAFETLMFVVTEPELTLITVKTVPPPVPDPLSILPVNTAVVPLAPVLKATALPKEEKIVSRVTLIKEFPLLFEYAILLVPCPTATHRLKTSLYATPLPLPDNAAVPNPTQVLPSGDLANEFPPRPAAIHLSLSPVLYAMSRADVVKVVEPSPVQDVPFVDHASELVPAPTATHKLLVPLLYATPLHDVVKMVEPKPVQENPSTEYASLSAPVLAPATHNGADVELLFPIAFISFLIVGFKKNLFSWANAVVTLEEAVVKNECVHCRGYHIINDNCAGVGAGLHGHGACDHRVPRDLNGWRCDLQSGAYFFQSSNFCDIIGVHKGQQVSGHRVTHNGVDG